MMPRYQTVFFTILLVASLAMGVGLWELRDHAHQRMVAGEDSTPTQAPMVASAEQATLLVASDADSSLLAQVQSLPLPQDSGARARVVLDKLLSLYAAPDSSHPVPGSANPIAQVFLLPAPELPGASGSNTSAKHPATSAPAKDSSQTGPQLAVVNLTGSFVANHPSGLQTETLTVLSICATLHANLPRVTQVRFLVDGLERATLAGHADLTRTYLAAETVPVEGVHP
jgi:hypothetical protein